MKTWIQTKWTYLNLFMLFHQLGDQRQAEYNLHLFFGTDPDSHMDIKP